MGDLAVCDKCYHLRIHHFIKLIRSKTACSEEGCNCNSFKEMNGYE